MNPGQFTEQVTKAGQLAAEEGVVGGHDVAAEIGQPGGPPVRTAQHALGVGFGQPAADGVRLQPPAGARVGERQPPAAAVVDPELLEHPGSGRDRGEGDPPGGRVVGDGEDQLPDARPGDGAAQPRGEQRPLVDQHRAGQRADRPAGVRVQHHHRPGERPGRPGARPEGRPTPRRPGYRQPRAPPVHRRLLGHPRGRTAARRGRLLRPLPQGRVRRDQGTPVLVVQPGGVAAGQHVHQADAGEARVLRLHRLLPE